MTQDAQDSRKEHPEGAEYKGATTIETPVEPLDPDDSTNIRGSFSDNQQEKMQILEMLRDGKVTVDEAERLLKALD